MINEKIALINAKIKEFDFLEITLLSHTNGRLVLACSADFCYYHNFEIRFKDTFTVIVNSNWEVDTSKNLICLVENLDELFYLNKKYKVEEGHSIFKMLSSEMVEFYVFSKEIDWVDQVVLYYS